MDNSQNIRDRLQLLLELASGKFYLHIGNVTELDSAGLGVLVGLHMTARKRKVDFVLVAPTAGQMRLLETTRLTSILSILSGLEAETLRQRLARPDQGVSEPEATQH